MALVGAVVAAALVVAVPQGAPANFIPDWTLVGSDLSEDWTALGEASWSAVDGELVGTPTAPEGGWLLLNDWASRLSVRRVSPLRSGV